MSVRSVDADLLLDARVGLGEGPIWHPDRAQVSWVELYEGRLHWLSLDGTPGRSIEVGRRVGSAVAATDGSMMLATDEGFARLDDEGVRVVAPVEADVDSFLNDGKCDAHGRLWAGTVGVGDDGLAVPAGGSLYRLELDGSVTRCLAGTTIANGMDWTDDDATFYFIDSGTGTIDAWDFDLDSGEIGGRRAIVEIDKDDGFADGMCLDTDGCIWTAVWGASEVRRYTPAGVLDQAVRLPVTQPTSVIFAGEHLDVLVITTASRHLSPVEQERQAHAGSVFCVRPGVSGRPTHSCAARTGE